MMWYNLCTLLSHLYPMKTLDIVAINDVDSEFPSRTARTVTDYFHVTVVCHVKIYV